MSSFTPYQWRDEEAASNYGDGISRPKPDARVREYRLNVYKPGAPPMIWTTRAESKRHAIRYAQARWPGSVAEVA